MDDPKKKGVPANDDVDVIFVRRFFHRRAKKYIYAPPGKAFRLEIRKKSSNS